jgi:hypothetical protein
MIRCKTIHFQMQSIWAFGSARHDRPQCPHQTPPEGRSSSLLICTRTGRPRMSNWENGDSRTTARITFIQNCKNIMPMCVKTTGYHDWHNNFIAKQLNDREVNLHIHINRYLPLFPTSSLSWHLNNQWTSSELVKYNPQCHPQRTQLISTLNDGIPQFPEKKWVFSELWCYPKRTHRAPTS